MSELSSQMTLAWQIACGGPFPDPEAFLGDEHFMALALREAMKGVGLSSPNPPVGCLLVKDGRVLGRGVHTRAGDPHGEVMALRDAALADADLQGACAYVTLEPCCHWGRTPPCTEALIQAGVRRVVIGVRDLNPRVDGGGMAILRNHGLEVLEGVLSPACSRFHAPFFKLIRTGLPWVTLKLALGSDQAMGEVDRSAQVTSRSVQDLAHALRRASDGIWVGRGTVAIDDPLLTDRWPAPTPPHRRFLRVVMDSRGSLPPTARVWRPVQGQPTIRALVQEVQALRGVEDLSLPPGPGGCSLRHLLHELAVRGVGRLLLEGGKTLAATALEAELVDECHLFQSEEPAGGPPVHLRALEAWTLEQVVPLEKCRWMILRP